MSSPHVMTTRHGRFHDEATEHVDRAGGFYQRLVLRQASFPVAAALHRSGVTPNRATAIGVALGIGAAIGGALGGYAGYLAAAVLWHGSRLMDFVDGNLARAQSLKLWSGKFLDGLSDATLNGVIVVAVGVGVGGWVMTYACVAVWLSTLGAYALLRYLHLLELAAADREQTGMATGSARSVSVGRARRWLSYGEGTDRELVLPAMIVTAVLNEPGWWVVGGGTLRLGIGVATFAGIVLRGADELNVRWRER